MQLDLPDHIDIRELDARAVRASVAVAASVTPDRLGLPTPCTGWSLGDLLAHMAAQHRGFAAAAIGNGGDPEAWEVRPLGDDPLSAYADAAGHVIEAFSGDGVLERQFALPDFTTRQTFPGRQAISFHFIDYVVHSWDVARSLDVPLELDPGVVEAGLTIARKIPNGPGRLVPGAAFAPALPVPPQALPVEEIMALLGRPPDWSRG